MEFNASPFPENLPWININAALTLEKLKGHVILLNFWTYSNINSINIIADLNWLETKYKGRPLVIIGIHQPTFENQKRIENVQSAVKRYKIQYPVLIDNEKQLGNNYSIHILPAFILINTTGRIIGAVTGEGKKTMLDNVIAAALVQGRNENTLIAEAIVERYVEKHEESILSFPSKIDIENKGKFLFISDSGNNRVLQVELEEPYKGKIVDVIGGREAGKEDGTYSSVRFNDPQGITYYDNTLYVADRGNHIIRKVDLIKRKVTTIAGSGVQGYMRYYCGEATEVSLNSPQDVTVDGQYLYIAFAASHQIWRFNLEKQIIETFTGTGNKGLVDGTSDTALLAQPAGIEVEGNQLYLVDSETSSFRYVDILTGEVKTYIGKESAESGMENGNFTEALLQYPLGLDVAGDKVFIADTYNHAIRVADISMNVIKTIIDSVQNKICVIDDKVCGELPLYEPCDVVYFNNKLYIADTNNHLIRGFDLGNRQLKNIELTDAWRLTQK